MNDLADTYRQLALPRTHEQLAEHYRNAERHGKRLSEHRDAPPARPITALATAVPPSATLSVAIHTVHALPNHLDLALPEQLLQTAQRNATDALHRCRHALELDAAEHGYQAEDWLPTIYYIAGRLLQSARPDKEPPTLVQGSAGRDQLAVESNRRAGRELRASPDQRRRGARSTTRRLDLH